MKLYSIEGIELPLIYDGKFVYTHNLPIGFYILQFETNDGIKTKNLVIRN